METKKFLDGVAGYLNRNYCQDSGNYDIFNGSKPDAFLYNEHTAAGFWSCGAIACIGSLLHFIGEDDGNWFLTHNGMQSAFSTGWSESFGMQCKDSKSLSKSMGIRFVFQELTQFVIIVYKNIYYENVLCITGTI